MVTSNSASAASSSRAVSSRRSRSSSVSVPRPTSRRTSSSHDGGFRNTNSASGIARATCRAPCRSISSSAGRPVGQRLLDRAARGAVAGGLVHDRPLEQLAVRRPSVELLVGDEPVVHAVHLPRPRRPGGRRDRDPDLGVVPADVGGDGALADRGRPGEHDETAGAGAHVSSSRGANSRSSAATCLVPEAAHPAALGDAEPLHESAAPAPCRGRASTAAGRRPASCR